MKHILIVDTSTLKGHHEIYFQKILATLTKNGYFVYGYCEDNNLIANKLTKEQLSLCQFLEFSFSLLDKILFKVLVFLDKIKIFYYLFNYNFSSIIPLLCVRHLIKKVAEEDVPVFFLHADSIIPNVPLWLAKMLFPQSWSTLYVQPSGTEKSINQRKLLSEKVFSLDSCKVVLFLDQAYLPRFSKKFPNTHCLYLPEIINTNVHVKGKFELASQVLGMANNRKIVSIIGSLLPKRNLLLFLEAASLLSSKQFFILVVGKLPTHLYSQEEISKIQKYCKSLQKNSYIKMDLYIPEEEEFNILLMISNVIYLQYKSHPFSSNILAKAIKLRKPVIVNPGYLMEKTVKTYDWQAIIPENPDKVAKMIEWLAFNFKINENKYNQFVINHSDLKFESTILNTVNHL